ncbi:replication initiator [Streptomyces sp. Je 1-369]|uniref:replication initiator n=1 Tax=Streptomyces sp. Je 1-369 TaxID=2966192 RepID=UPI0022854989|nr:replication initiator [Streptomyces sp. Je 1-369]WAL96542.1 replication initiation protein [Streptomyces sp. Je 1-369]
MPQPLDLRHVASLAVRDLIELANGDNFDRVHNQVKAVRGCTHPIRLAGYTQTVHAPTGRVLHSFNTADDPTGRILVACGNRRASRCPSCSRIYAGDTYQLIKAGVVGGKSIPTEVRTHPRVFATLTAPSFGPVHGLTWRDRPGCRCGGHHADNDPAIGTPVDPARYDYTGAVLFNAHAGELWGRFTTYLRRYVAHLLNMTQKAAAEVVRVSFAKVAEYQKRGVVHFHAIVRFDGPEGSSTPPPAEATAGVLAKAVKLAARHVTLIVDSDRIGARTLRWGRQVDVRQITADDGKGRVTAEAVAGYIAKYATKGAEDSGTIDRPLYCRDCRGHGMTTSVAGVPEPCDTCTGTGRESLAHLPVAGHVRQMIRTCWDLGALPEFKELKLWKWAHMLGFRGHFSTKSRRYSTTLGALREERRAWQAEQRRAVLDVEDTETEATDDTTLVFSDWTFLGTGYSPGEELLAAQVRNDLAEARAEKERAKTEGALWL